MLVKCSINQMMIFIPRINQTQCYSRNKINQQFIELITLKQNIKKFYKPMRRYQYDNEIKISLLIISILLYYFISRSMNLTNFSLRYVRLTHAEDLEGYYLREKQSIFSSPKIITGKVKQHVLTVYVENIRQYFSIEIWKYFPHKQLLQYLENIIVGFNSLRKKFGCFKIYEKLVLLNQNYNIRIWIHSDPILNYRQYPMPNDINSEFLMVMQLINMFASLVKQLQQFKMSYTFHNLLNFIKKISQIKFTTNHKFQEPMSPRKVSMHSFYEPVSKINQMISPTAKNYSKNKTFFPYYTNQQKNNIERTSMRAFVSPTNNFCNQRRKYSNFNEEQRSSHFVQRKKSINFTYSNQDPLSKRQSQQMNSSTHEFANSQFQKLFASKQPKSNNKNESLNSVSAVLNHQSRQRSKPKFPHSTQSTFVTLKDTKRFDNTYFDDNLNIPIQQELETRTIMKTSNNNNGSDNHGDILDEFQNLFFGDMDQQKEQEQKKKVQEYEQREAEFEELFD